MPPQNHFYPSHNDEEDVQHLLHLLAPNNFLKSNQNDSKLNFFEHYSTASRDRFFY